MKRLLLALLATAVGGLYADAPAVTGAPVPVADDAPAMAKEVKTVKVKKAKKVKVKKEKKATKAKKAKKATKEKKGHRTHKGSGPVMHEQ